MRKQILLVATTALAVIVAGCNPPDDSGVPEAWKKTPASEKLERIKKMPISAQMKIDGINKLEVSQEEKDKAIDEIKAMPSN